MASNFQSTSLSPNDQARINTIIDHVKRTQGIELKTPDAIRAAFGAWEFLNLPKKRKPGTVPSMDENPEAHQRWVDEQIDKQMNPLEDN